MRAKRFASILIFFFFACSTLAQAQLQLIIDSLNATKFPKLSAKIRVLDGGAYVTGLNVTNFTVLEDGLVQAPITATCNDTAKSTPVSVMLVIDRSGSMASGGLTAAKTAAKRFLDRLSPQDESALMSFGGSVAYDQSWTTNITAMKNAIDQLSSTGGTPLWRAVKTGSQYTKPRVKKKVLIVLTDGEDSEFPRTTTLQDAINQVRSDSVLVFTIGLGSSLDESGLRTLATSSGGAYYAAPTNNDLDQIYQAIARLITTGGLCEIGYTSQLDCWNGSTHTVEISVRVGSQTASATANFTLPLDSATFSFVELAMNRDYVVEQDSTISIPIRLTRVSPNRPPRLFQFSLDFDKTMLELVTVDTTSLTGGYNVQVMPSTNGSEIRLIGMKPVTQPGELVVVRFHAFTSFDSKKSSVRVSPPDVQEFCTVATSSDGLITISGRCERAVRAGIGTQQIRSAINSVSPNPFNPTTVIEFTIGCAGKTTLRLFDMLGREVATVVNGELTAGSYSRQFNASALSSGRYFLTLTAPDRTDSRMVVVVK